MAGGVALGRLCIGFLFVAMCLFSGESKVMEEQGNPKNVNDESIVKTENGFVQGLVLPTARAFLGIPFAVPPVGSLRWKAPQPHPAWAPNTLPAKAYRPGCPQVCLLPPITCPPSISEDCLYLNVWTPRLATLKAPAPVMVFLPGGRFEEGGADTILYNSEFTSNRTNTIVVTVAYRLGALGFLVIDGLLHGNFGFYDQRLAMKWVLKNIAAFGGDPTQITLYGQSAGGTSTASHVVATGSLGLFSRVIIQSNPWTLALTTEIQARDLGNRFLEDIKCKTNPMSCLLNASVDEILAAQLKSENYISILYPLRIFYPWTPLVDGVDIVQNPMDAFMAGKIPKQISSVMLGTVANESILFIYEAFHSPLTRLEYDSLITAIFGAAAFQILQIYPAEAYNKDDARVALSHLTTDYIFTCPTRNISASLVSKTQTKVWLYYFNHVLSFSDAWGPNFTFCYQTVCHASELPFVFHSATDGGFQYTPGELILANSMVYHWANFGRTGSPNNGVPVNVTAPPYNPSKDEIIVYAVPVTTQVHLKKANCDFWDSIGYHFGF